MMKVTDYIVNFLIEKGIYDVFGYPGGMVTHLMDSFEKRKLEIHAHVNYHEQGAAFAACGYAQSSGKPGVAYATSGPGATNLITGICNAYFDSIPVLFITGQVNTFETKGDLGIRQRGFQETDIVSMVTGVTKLAVRIEQAEQIKYYLEKAWNICLSGRKGPVLLDIPMNIQRAEVDPDSLLGYDEEPIKKRDIPIQEVIEMIKDSNRPCIVAGAGIKSKEDIEAFKKVVSLYKIPVVTSLPGIGVLGYDNPYYFGFLGAYGNRYANFILAKADLIITIGTRLDIRQTGAIRENFGANSKLIRIDIDEEELNYHVRPEEMTVCCSASEMLDILKQYGENESDRTEWLDVCEKIRKTLKGIDDTRANVLVQKLSMYSRENCVITTDVGQNQVWVAQSFLMKENQQMLFSAGHGAMGYSLPAAIGAYYGTGQPVICFNGDGGFQMNLQELQFIARERLPIQIIILNNYALGMIRHFQEMYFNSQFAQTVEEGGYKVPSFEKLAWAYGIEYKKVYDKEDITPEIFDWTSPCIIEVQMDEPTYVYPKLEYGKPNQDQEPLLDRKLYEELMTW